MRLITSFRVVNLGFPDPKMPQILPKSISYFDILYMCIMLRNEIHTTKWIG